MIFNHWLCYLSLMIQRHVEPLMLAGLADSPVVLIWHGKHRRRRRRRKCWWQRRLRRRDCELLNCYRTLRARLAGFQFPFPRLRLETCQTGARPPILTHGFISAPLRSRSISPMREPKALALSRRLRAFNSPSRLRLETCQTHTPPRTLPGGIPAPTASLRFT